MAWFNQLMLSAFTSVLAMITWAYHINQNKLDNNLSNLEYMTRRDNFIYSIDKTKTSSKYIGVTKKGNKWQVIKNKKYIGIYPSEELAHKAYVGAK